MVLSFAQRRGGRSIVDAALKTLPKLHYFVQNLLIIAIQNQQMLNGFTTFLDHALHKD